jgi:hypothetical protein
LLNFPISEGWSNLTQILTLYIDALLYASLGKENDQSPGRHVSYVGPHALLGCVQPYLVTAIKLLLNDTSSSTFFQFVPSFHKVRTESRVVLTICQSQ